MAGGRGRIYVPMPQAEAYGGSYRDELAKRWGDPTVTRAETAVIINVLIYIGVFKKEEFVEMVETMCRKIDSDRQEQAQGFKR